MNCPVCDERLRTVEKYGLEIDLCPGCKGIWLDRGKLGTILSQAVAQPVDVAATTTGATTPPVLRETAPVLLPRAYRQADHDDHDHDDHDDHNDHDRNRDDHHDQRGQFDHPTDQHQVGRHKRRGSLLGDLLGVFGGDD